MCYARVNVTPNHPGVVALLKRKNKLRENCEPIKEKKTGIIVNHVKLVSETLMLLCTGE